LQACAVATPFVRSNIAAMPQDNPDPQVVPYLLYADVGAAMDWLIKVFAFTERARDNNSDGTVRHAELLLDNGGVIMLGSPGPDLCGPAKLGADQGEPCTQLHSGRSRRSSLVLQRALLNPRPRPPTPAQCRTKDLKVRL
jgi:hypothetical protein